VHNPGAPSYEGAEHFMGTGSRPGGAIVVRELVDHVADRMAADARILKEKRKQNEYRQLQGGGEGRGRGRGRGGRGGPQTSAAEGN
jgi:hypothetical protein